MSIIFITQVYNFSCAITFILSQEHYELLIALILLLISGNSNLILYYVKIISHTFWKACRINLLIH